MDDITWRLEAADHAIGELCVAAMMSKYGGEDFVCRMLARHVVVRSCDLLVIWRRIRKPLNRLGRDTSRLKTQVDAFEASVVSPMKLTRDRISAHVQDLDFMERIRLWQQLDLRAVDDAFEAALKVRHALDECIGGIGRFPDLPEIDDPALRNLLGIFKRKTEPDGLTRMSSDPLASEQENMGSLLNFTPTHLRCGQIVLLAKWIDLQLELASLVADFGKADLVVRARLLTDVVSLHDCLFQREDGPTEVEGLDKLLVKAGDLHAQEAAEFLNLFRKKRTTQRDIEPFRDVRNTFGAHLDTSSQQPIADLCVRAQQIDLKAIRFVYESCLEAFDRACSDVIYLGGHRISREPLYAVHPGRRKDDRPYDPTTKKPEISSRRIYLDSRDRAAVERCLDNWIAQRSDDGEERRALWDALCAPDWGLAHEVILARLVSGQIVNDSFRVLELVVSCARGNPRLLSELLVKYYRSGNMVQALVPAVLRCLSNVGEWREEEVHIATAQLQADSRDTRIEAANALLGIFVGAEQRTRANGPGSVYDYEECVARRTAVLLPEERMVHLAHVVSVVRWSHTVGTPPRFLAELVSAKKQLVHELGRMKVDEGDLNFPLATDNMIRFLAICAEKASCPKDTAKLFFSAAGKWVKAGTSPIAHLDLAYALGKAGDPIGCEETAEFVVRRNPVSADLAVAAVYVMREGGCPHEKVVSLGRRIKRSFILSPDESRNLEELLASTC